jgi:hypothetical protein
VNPWYYLIIAVGMIVAIINFSLAWAHRERRLQALVRFVAGVVSLVPPVGILLAELALQMNLRPVNHDPNLPKYVFIAAGLFIGGTLMLPAYIERSGDASQGLTLQQRAARPANATIRLQKNGDDWLT